MHQIKSIPVAGPWITDREIAYVTDAVTNGWYENANTYIERFESAFKNYLGRKYAISLPSCTSALHLSLLALGVGPGDEVIIPDATWIASAAPITYVGATPVFVDIDPQTWCLSAETVQPALTDRTKAIITVNLYGHMPAYDELQSYEIPLIEDAAESIGSMYKGQLAGTFGVTSCFSFHGSKTLTTGEGGMLVTDNDHLYEQCMILRDHGRRPGDTMFQNFRVGYKYKMSALQAALGLGQLERIEELIGRKREIFGWYREMCSDIVSLNPDHPDVANSYWMTTATFPNINKEDVIKKLKENKVDSRPFFDPLTSLPAYRDNRCYNENAHRIARKSVNLPSGGNLTRSDVIYIREILDEIA